MNKQASLKSSSSKSLLGKAFRNKNSALKAADSLHTTQQKQSQHSLEQARARAEAEQQRLHDLFMQAPAMIAVLRGPQLVYELANPLYLKVVGKTEAILGKGVLEVFPEPKDQPIEDILFNVYKTGKPFVGSEVLVKLDRNNDGHPEDIYFTFIVSS